MSGLVFQQYVSSALMGARPISTQVTTSRATSGPPSTNGPTPAFQRTIAANTTDSTPDFLNHTANKLISTTVTPPAYSTTSMQLMPTTPVQTETAETVDPPAPTAPTDSTEVPVGAGLPEVHPAAPATPAGKPEAQPSTDELVHRLFEPLAARLKAELRLDRERAGLVTDLRY